MFTGIIEELGKVADLKVLPDSAQLTLEGTKVLEGTQIGDSIAVNGICLTVVKMQGNLFTVDVMAETLNKTNLKECSRETRVNLERALQLSTRLGGHLVSGHVDGVGTIQKITPVGIARVFTIKAAPELLTYVLPKGSIAIDGISLTVVDLLPQAFTISLIPHTRQETTLGFKGVGDMVNLETDLIGKYVARFMEKKEAPPKDLSMSFLAENGFI
ncbi:riboflavin synthase alpha chain [Desulfitobacterium sp. LBE]|uniref:Riboflavin synthase n=1 Tax=Desulfitobacterium hafniense (strain Y51) TaxID=138119 RepID=Q24WZ0_DESHY|nr:MULTISPECIES: riboflavin synthase [Desulfitobacterium]TWH56343.1 riboflavin synthase alpha chain [Desulfitobacterium sp. LBE]BAE83452.1 riboflavin synthase alpha chain [Desulfitobacterium hafniense Y51]